MFAGAEHQQTYQIRVLSTYAEQLPIGLVFALDACFHNYLGVWVPG
jgi:hypothetical protein